jgi:hypothetical protein
MTCAADCDTCDPDAWHLHVTVEPAPAWARADVAKALLYDAKKHDFESVVVTNVIPRDPRTGRPERTYRELIPTRHLRGTEAEASAEIFRMGVALNNAGWIVRRLKIEGDARLVYPGRALYYETHMKNPPRATNLPISRNSRGDVIHTLRRSNKDDIKLALFNIFGDDAEYPRMEACVLDTAPELDDEWMRSYR